MERLPAPLLAQATAHLLLHIALLIPPSTLSHQKLALAFLPAIWACDIYTWNSGLGFLAIAHGLWAWELLGFRRVREEFSCVRYGRVVQKKVKIEEKDQSKKKNNEEKEYRAKVKDIGTWKEPYPSNFWKRLFWVSNVICSLRYTGWETCPSPISPTNTTINSIVPPRTLTKTKPPSRLTFLLKELIRTSTCIILTDLISFYTHYDPYFQISTPINEPFPRRLRTFLTTYHIHHLPSQIVRILIFGLQQYAVLSLLISIPAIFLVGLGALGIVGDFWGGTQNWKPAMGNPFLIPRRGLRGFWHQNLRNILTGPGHELATQLLGLPEKSLLGYATKIASAFAISSFLHVSTLPLASDLGFLGLSPLRYVAFFWTQGALVLVEVVASYLLNKKCSKTKRNSIRKMVLAVVRLVWVVGVMYWTARLIVDESAKVSRAFGLKQPFLIKLPKK